MWEDVITTMVRTIINDLDPENQEFDDTKIQTSIVVAAILVSKEFSLENNYIIDISNISITPDPVAKNDNEFLALVSLKSACMFSLSRFQTALRRGIKVKDGDSSVDTTAGFGGYRDILDKGPCASYESLLKELSVKKSMGLGRAVTGPATHINSLRPGPQSVPWFFDNLGRG